MQNNDTRTTIFGVGIDKLTSGHLLQLITTVDPNRQIVIANVNVHGLNIAYTNEAYRQFLKKADAVFNDGFGVAWGAKILGYSMESQYRSTCADWIECLASLCQQKNLGIFLLAGEPGVASEASEKLKAKFPDLRIGSHHGFFQHSGPENENIIKTINEFAPEILYVGLGMPLQEFWIDNNRALLNAKVILPLGACLDIYTGRKSRAPKWMTEHGLEWLGRLWFEPRRVWKRYLIGNPLFLIRALWERIGGVRFS